MPRVVSSPITPIQRQGDPGTGRGLSDEHGDYAAGTFLMNPHGSRHSPRSEPGSTLFVRLRQYPGANRPRLVEDTNDLGGWRAGLVEGLGVRPLYAQGGDPEYVALASG